MPTSQAVRKAGYKKGTLSGRDALAADVDYWLNQAGATRELVARVRAEALGAVKHEPVGAEISEDGKSLVYEKVPDHKSRLAAADQISRLRGEYKDKVDLGLPEPMTVNLVNYPELPGKGSQTVTPSPAVPAPRPALSPGEEPK